MNFLTDSLLTFRGIATYKRFLRTSDRLEPNLIQQRQQEWLSNVLRQANASIPWYSEYFKIHGVNPGASNSFAELAKLPILTKDRVREITSYLHDSPISKRAIKLATSGTTGQPLVTYTSYKQWVIEQAAVWRQWKWAGYNLRDRMAIFRSYMPKPGQPRIRIDRLRNWAYFSVFDMNDSCLSEYAQFLQNWQPRFLRGYPSSLMLLSQHALRHGWKLQSLKAAFTASEVVPLELRDLLQRAFGVQLFDHYGQAEITCMFHDCEKHEGMHLDWEYGIVELVPSHQPGIQRIIATNLWNTVVPLLRYDTGDLAVGDWTVCSCGRTSPLVSSIRGRQDDYLIAKDGSRVPTINLYTYFSKFRDISRFQILQRVPGQLIVCIALWNESDTAAKAKLAEIIAQDLEKSTGFLVYLPSSPSFIQSREGKWPVFVQQIQR